MPLPARRRRGTARGERARDGQRLQVALRRLAALVAVALLAACSSGDHRDSSTTTTTEREGKAVDGGTLTVVVPDAPSSFDPTQAEYGPGAMTYALAVFDTMLTLDAKGDVEPALVDAYEPNADRTAWTLHVRAGATFSDGSAVDASAVAGALDRMRQSLVGAGELRDLDAIEVVDASDVRLTMKSPWSTFPVHLTGQFGLVPAPSSTAAAPVGSGPFTLKTWTPGRPATFARRDGHWSNPKLDTLVLQTSGRGDLRVEGHGATRVVFNTTAAPFDRAACRVAVAAAATGAKTKTSDCAKKAFSLATDDAHDAIATRIADAGFDVKVDARPSSQLLVDALLGHFDAVHVDARPIIDDDELFAALDPHAAADVGTLGTNLGRFVDDRLVALFTEARAEPDASKRAAIDDDIEARIASQAPWIDVTRASWRYVRTGKVDGLRVVRPGTLSPAALHRTR